MGATSIRFFRGVYFVFLFGSREYTLCHRQLDLISMSLNYKINITNPLGEIKLFEF